MDRSRKELLLIAVRLPARLDSEEAGILLGFLDHEMTILLGAGMFKGVLLGKPSPNGRKFFCRDAILNLGQDYDWLDKATKVIANHWKSKNSKQAELL